MLVKIVDDIDLNEVYAALQNPSAGAVNLFVGTVRSHSNGKEVVRLEFESYDGMALQQMNHIAERAVEKWNLCQLVMVHARGGKVPGQPVVVVGVSSAHRHDSFSACRFLIDELKKTVPIWKKEFYEDTSSWINAHP